MPLRHYLTGWLCVVTSFALTGVNRAEKPSFRDQDKENRRTIVTDAEVAKEALERNAKRREQLEQRLQDLQKWTSAQFEIGEREVMWDPLESTCRHASLSIL